MSTIALASATRAEMEEAGATAVLASLRQMSDREVEALFAGPNRQTVLDLIFDTMPRIFRSDRAGATNAVVHWNMTGGPQGQTDSYSMTIADGTCAVVHGIEGAPSVALSMSAPDFIKVITKTGNPVMMFMMGKIKATGDVGLAANVGGFFSVPKA